MLGTKLILYVVVSDLRHFGLQPKTSWYSKNKMVEGPNEISQSILIRHIHREYIC